MRHALGTVVFYGMIGVTFFGLFLTPVFYTVIRKIGGDRPIRARRPGGSLPETHERYAATFTHPASTFWRRISTSRQEQQVGRFLGIPEKRLARRAYLRTHLKATSKINELACADGHRKVGRDFSSGDPVPETTFHQRHGASGSVLQEFPDLSVVHKRRDAQEKTSAS